MARTLTLTRPDDWHLHLRDGPGMTDVVPATAAVFGRAICMPNLVPPVRTAAEARAYRERILAALPEGSTFQPLMALYLTDETSVSDIEAAVAEPHVHAVKLYPAGATTNSASGVTDLARVQPTLDAMAQLGLPLLVHGEVTHGTVDIFDREAAFLADVFAPLLDRHPRLRVVFEHVTTAEVAQFVAGRDDDRVGATITAHHLLLDRNALFDGGLRPHHYCLPVLKRARHREALLDAATSGDPRFFLGTDSAPHTRSSKESACGCAGMYTAPHALALYAEAFDERDALHRLQGFASEHGADWYGLPRNTDSITLTEATTAIPEELPFAGEVVVPFRAGGTTAWRVS